MSMLFDPGPGLYGGPLTPEETTVNDVHDTRWPDASCIGLATRKKERGADSGPADCRLSNVNMSSQEY